MQWHLMINVPAIDALLSQVVSTSNWPAAAALLTAAAATTATRLFRPARITRGGGTTLS